MDFQNRVGSKFGGGGVMSESAANADRRERLRKLALETVDLNKDPYFMVRGVHCQLTTTLTLFHSFTRFSVRMYAIFMHVNLRETIWGSTSANCA